MSIISSVMSEAWDQNVCWFAKQTWVKRPFKTFVSKQLLCLICLIIVITTSLSKLCVLTGVGLIQTHIICYSKFYIFHEEITGQLRSRQSIHLHIHLHVLLAKHLSQLNLAELPTRFNKAPHVTRLRNRASSSVNSLIPGFHEELFSRRQKWKNHISK